MKNDVFRFRYSEEYSKGKGDLYHCFDGILVEKIDSKGNPYWEDTYWSSDNRRFCSMEEIASKGTAKHICNLDDMEEIDEHRAKYYEKEDLVYLGIHKGYRGRHLKKKGAEMSKAVVLAGIKRKIEEIRSDVDYGIRKIEWLERDIREIESDERDLKHVSF